MNGALNGKSIKWNNQGQKLKEEHFSNGRHHGLFKTWYENGQLCSQITMKNDTVYKVIGKWEPDGSPT